MKDLRRDRRAFGLLLFGIYLFFLFLAWGSGEAPALIWSALFGIFGYSAGVQMARFGDGHGEPPLDDGPGEPS
jgi:hypothetical protein